MKKVLILILCVMALPIAITSCSKDDDVKDPYSSSWFAGKEFSAEDWPGRIHGTSGEVDWWILSMDGKGGAGYDGHFKVVPYWEDDEDELIYGILTNHKSYSGKYQIDYENNRLFISYDGYSANAIWYFGDEEYGQGEWPFWNPNRYIKIPETELGELAGLVFYSGNVYEGRKWDMEHGDY